MKGAKIGVIFSLNNRGILLDVCAFILNIFLIRLVTGSFIELTRAPDEDILSKYAVALFYTIMIMLAPLGAILKRHFFWQRIKAQGKEAQVSENIKFFVSPTICFVQTLIIFAMVVVWWNKALLPDSFISSTVVILAVSFGGLLYCFGNAFVVSKFFEADSSDPFWNFRGREFVDWFWNFFDKPLFDRLRNFLETPLAAALGDLCIFLNMICFQVFWGYLVSRPFSLNADGSDIFSASLLYLLLILVFYFPPRMFYLAEDIHRPIVWLTVLLANSPVILRVLLGTN